jgi:hypothetical protein
MSRWNTCGGLAIALSGAIGWASQALAQDPGVKTIEERTVVLTPRAEPIPALSIRFWPDEKELVEGDAMPLYMRAGILWVDLQGPQDSDRKKTFAELIMEGPVDPNNAEAIAKVKDWLSRLPSDAVIAELKRAALRREVRPYLRVDQLASTVEAVGLLLPEVQRSRDVARLLDLKIRVAIADGELDQAIELIRTGFRMATAVGSEDLLINKLVGLAIANMMLEDVGLMQSHPDCPNLYWALASLPRPLIDLRPAIQVELGNIARMWDPPVGAVLPQDEQGWNDLMMDTFDLLRGLSGQNTDGPSAGQRLGFLAAVTMLQGESTKHLRSMGISEAEIDRMFPSERVVRYLRFESRRWTDEHAKWLKLPMTVALPYLTRLEEMLADPSSTPNSEVRSIQAAPSWLSQVTLAMFKLLLPSITQAVRAQYRNQQSVDALLAVEAIRTYAHEHAGQLPDTLVDLQPLPALPDPATGQPWAYQAGETATLTLQVAGRPVDSEGAIRKYLIQVRK